MKLWKIQACDTMQVWLESGEKTSGVDMVLGDDLLIEDNVIFLEGKKAGKVIDVSNERGQNLAKSLAGIVEWILLEFGEWKMIPIENVIAACDGTVTKLAARISEQSQITGASFALEIGVDALLVPESIKESAIIAKSQRGESTTSQIDIIHDELKLNVLEITNITDGGIGDRVCVDLTSLLEVGEGMLVGSSSSSLALIHSETVESEFVPTRPFRVNAGPVNSYILMADKSTKYLSELRMGDEVMIVDSSGSTRLGTVGRLKIERRPLLKINWRYANNNEAGTFLQQAETVRLVSDSGDLISVTDLEVGMKIYGCNLHGSRHIGVTVQANVTER